jgi:3-hydroxy-3-methylglutaryl CoA synthase
MNAYERADYEYTAHYEAHSADVWRTKRPDVPDWAGNTYSKEYIRQMIRCYQDKAAMYAALAQQ